MYLHQWIEQVASHFPVANDAIYEARLLGEYVTKQSLTRQRFCNYLLSDDEYQRLNQLALRREHGEPIAYLLGWQPFYDLHLKVTPDTLIPRGDTEFMVDLVLQQISALHKPMILDLGTGSGAIALAIAKMRPDADIIAVDNSLAALTVARHNAHINQIKNVLFLCSYWSDAINNNAIDIIVTNPPYIADNDPHLASLQYEPINALVSADNGYADIKHILTQAPRILRSHGKLFMEHGYRQATHIQQLATNLPYWHDIHTYQDYGQQPRVTSMSFNLSP